MLGYPVQPGSVFSLGRDRQAVWDPRALSGCLASLTDLPSPTHSPHLSGRLLPAPHTSAGEGGWGSSAPQATGGQLPGPSGVECGARVWEQGSPLEKEEGTSISQARPLPPSLLPGLCWPALALPLLGGKQPGGWHAQVSEQEGRELSSGSFPHCPPSPPPQALVAVPVCDPGQNRAGTSDLTAGWGLPAWETPPTPVPCGQVSALKMQSGLPWEEGFPLCGEGLGPSQPEALPPGGRGRGSPRMLWVGWGCPWAAAPPYTPSLLSPQPSAALVSVSMAATACLAQPSFATVPEASRVPAVSTVSGRAFSHPSPCSLRFI